MIGSVLQPHYVPSSEIGDGGAMNGKIGKPIYVYACIISRFCGERQRYDRVESLSWIQDCRVYSTISCLLMFLLYQFVFFSTLEDRGILSAR